MTNDRPLKKASITMSAIFMVVLLMSGFVESPVGSPAATTVCAQGTCWACGGATCYPPNSPPEESACWSSGKSCCG